MADGSGAAFRSEGEASSRKSERKSNLNLSYLSPDVVFAFGWNRFNLRLIGLWPDQTCKDSQVSLIIRYSSPIWVLWITAFLVGPQTMAPIAYSFVLDEVIQLIANVAGIVGACVKMVVLWNNGEAWCLSFLVDDWTRKLTDEERELMMRYAKLGRSISVGFTLLMQSLVWSYIALKILPLFTLNLDTSNATDVGKALMYPAYFPFDLKKPSNFAFAWIGQLIATFTSTIAYTASDCFIAMLVIHLCGQISILRSAMFKLLDNEKSFESQIFREKLRLIVKRHEMLIRFAAVIEDAVNLMLLVLTLIYTIQFGIQFFGLMAAVNEREPGTFPFLNVLFFISYLNVTIVHLYLYCYVGEKLIEESEAMGLASYSCKWYHLSGKEARVLMLVMQRATTPLELSAGKFVTFSLELFGNVLKTSMSYFSVLLTMKEQQNA